jgi:hypothetical protein
MQQAGVVDWASQRRACLWEVESSNCSNFAMLLPRSSKVVSILLVRDMNLERNPWQVTKADSYSFLENWCRLHGCYWPTLGCAGSLSRS